MNQVEDWLNSAMEQDIKHAFAQYGQSLKDSDHKMTVGFIYPKLFNFIPKETILSGFRAAQENQPAKIVLDDFEITSIDTSFEVGAISFRLFTSQSKMEMIFPKSEEKSSEEDVDADGATEQDFTYEMLAEKYGENNVEYDKTIGVIRTKVISKLLGIKEEGKWYFLDVKAQLLELYEKFLPDIVVKNLAGLFPGKRNHTLAKTPNKKSRKDKSNKQVPTSGDLKHIYLAGWEVYFNGDQECENFMATQVTTKETVEMLYSGIELVFKKDRLVKAFDYTDGKKKERPLTDEETGLNYKDFPVNRFYRLDWSTRGNHQLGGEVPKGFTLPESKCVVPFQYLGYINDQDGNFKWLPFKFHLTCPIYLNIQNVFLDYSDPMRPEIINIDEVESADTSYDELDQSTEIVFEPQKFNFVESVTFSSIGHAGIPNWIQNPEIPMCPKSGKRMRFLCQLHGGVQTLRTNLKVTEEYTQGYFDKLNFWGDGDLFVFFEPTSKVACYFIQNT